MPKPSIRKLSRSSQLNGDTNSGRGSLREITLRVHGGGRMDKKCKTAEGCLVFLATEHFCSNKPHGTRSKAVGAARMGVFNGPPPSDPLPLRAAEGTLRSSCEAWRCAGSQQSTLV